MIDLITGLPGNCKTLYTIWMVKKWAEKDNRPVFYHGIKLTDEGKEKLVGWSELEDATKWYEVPTGSIVLIDEAQGIFRNRSINAQPPKHVTELETHRHLGIDLVVITQHPMLIDPAIRRLAGRHRHMVRIWGLEASTIHEWAAVRDNCDKPASRKDSDKTKWVFDKSIYSLYKSAELHTGKRSIPKRVWWLMAVPAAILAAVFTVKTLLLKPPVLPGASAAVAGQVSGAMPASSNQNVINPVADARQYAWKNMPRVELVAHTAPKYDDLTKPVRVPVPVMCVMTKTKCKCYTQQATPIAVFSQQCAEIAANGYFQEFDPDGKGEGEPVQSQAGPQGNVSRSVGG